MFLLCCSGRYEANTAISLFRINCSCFFWLKNRRPDRWRDVQNIDHVVGVYHISKAPLSEEDWIEEHASNAKQLELEAAPISS